ncbi:Gfo/Idh/MocA family oxidoreductase [Microbacterium ulmi]|uniref:Gfo/Idh/MocA family protein n=1 Tax=Microbacterium ulmi TaxID=179095 RepID=UPI0031CE20FC
MTPNGRRDTAAAPRRRLRWGVVGLGVIATAFVRSLHDHSDERVVTVASRDKERSERFASLFGVDRAYGSYDALFGDPDVEAVYIAVPHALHADLAIRAVEAGKHTLVEKPLAGSAEEAERIVAAGRRAGVLVMEAMWSQYLPQAAFVRRHLAAGTIGAVRSVIVDLSSGPMMDPLHRLLAPELGGGTLLDVGVYGVSWALLTLGDPFEVMATGIRTEDGVDLHASVSTLTSAPGVASMVFSLIAPTRTRLVLAGEKGSIELHGRFFEPTSLDILDAEREVVESWHDTSPRIGRGALAYQAEAMSTYVSEGRTDSPVYSSATAIAALRVIDSAREQIASRGAVISWPPR